MRNIVKEIVNDISLSDNKTLNTLLPKSKITYFVDHAINTVVFSVLIGYKYGFKYSELMSLATGALLHDIGKIISGAGTLYNKDIVRTLFNIVPIYPVGVYIKVTKCDDSSLIGKYGVVADINQENLNKPVIILITDNKFNKIKPFRIDASHFDNVKLELIL